MAITDYKVSETYAGRDISSLSDRPNEDGLSASALKARFDQLGKEVIPNYNDLIDFINLNLFSGGTQIGHTHNVDILEDGTTNRLYTDVEKTKLGAIAEGAEVNQNAFGNVKVGSTTIASSVKTDTLELVAGLNVSIAVDALTKKITLSATGDLATEAVQSYIEDIGNYFTSLNVEGALQEVGAKLSPSSSKTTPVDADTLLIADSEASNVFKKLSWVNIKATLKTYFDTLYNLYVHPTNHAPSIIEQDASNRFVTDAEKTTWNGKQAELVSGTNIKTINGNSVLGSGNLPTDWNVLNATLTYASADSPTFVANTSVGLTSFISVGMKIKLTQTTVKYFIVTAITSTTITLYGGTDYTLANATITLPYFSFVKAPFGFPLNPSKWTVTASFATNVAQTSPTANTWYNLNSALITVPIGSWIVDYFSVAQCGAGTSQDRYLNVTLSTANNTQSNSAYSNKFAQPACTFSRFPFAKAFPYLITSKTILYFNTMSNTNSDSLSNLNNETPTIIKAVCAYL